MRFSPRHVVRPRGLNCAMGLGLAALIALGCGGPRGGTDVGNGASVSVDVQGVVQVVPAGSSGPELFVASRATLTNAWIGVKRFKLLGKASCTSLPDKQQPDMAGPFAADLLNGGVQGQKPEGVVPEGEYCGFQLSLHALKKGELPSGAPAELQNLSVYLSGRRADGIPFVVKSSRPLNVVLRSEPDAYFDVRDEEPFIVGLDLPALIAALDLDSLAGPSIVIDEQTNKDRLLDFEATLRKRAAFFEDKNGDGMLSPDEVGEDNQLAAGDPSSGEPND